jgi:diguanylate cyclase (GGDEF)-like protein/PAS domain S-box-containing protein
MLKISTERKVQFFNELMDNSNVGILVADKNRRNIFVNQRTCEMFGYSEEELLGEFAEIFHLSKESSEHFGELVLDAVLKGKKVGIDYEWRRKDGSTFWGHIAGSVTQESQEVLWTLFDVSDRIEAEAIQLKNRQQAEIIEQIHEAVVAVDLKGIVTSWNNGATLLTGYDRDEMLGYSIEKLYYKEDIPLLYKGMKEIQTMGHSNRERTLRRKDGSSIDILLSSSLLKDKEGNVTHLIGYAQDITLLKKAQERMLHADMFYALVENAFVAIYVIHNGKFIYTNKKFQDIFGYTYKELQNRNSLELIHPDDRELVLQHIKKRNDEIGLGIEYSFKGVKKSGEILDAHVYGSSLMLDSDRQAIIGTLTDDTEINLNKKKLEILANQDSLTEVYNRNYFNVQLKRAISSAKRHNHKMALILFDIDNFKRVNDSLGHQAGDIIIQQTAKRIAKLLRESDTFFRIGGDEFTIIIENYKDRGEITALLSRISSAMSESIEIENVAFHISLSIGISLFPQNAQDAVSLQKRADLAMYEAKSNGKNHYQFYNENSLEQLDKENLEDELFQAYENGHFELFLQAQLSSNEEKLLGAEALIRWSHPTRGIILPDRFLPLAEEVGLLYKLDLYMLERALKLLKKYTDRGEQHFNISVNISNALFMHQRFIDSVETLVMEYREEIKYIELELTENITMKNESYSKDVIQKLKSLGFKISIDDFGTGYSSLSHLKMLDIDELKIDKSFIDDISTNKTDKSIVKAIVEMSKALSLVSVAEGVEKKDQLDILKEMGCNLIQGYYFSKPLSIEDFETKWLS